MNFCTKCGNALEPGLRFCTRCGAPVVPAPQQATPDVPPLPAPLEVAPPAAAEIPAPPSASEWQPLLPVESTQQVQAAPQPATTSKSSCLPAILITLAALAVLAVLVIGGVVYLGYRVKDKVGEFTRGERSSNSKASPQNERQPAKDKIAGQASKDPDADQAAKALDGIGGLMDRMGFGDPPPNPYSDLPTVKSQDVYKNRCANADAAKDLPPPVPAELGPSRIPMRTGLVLVHAWGRKSGDSESINSVTQLTDRFAEISDSGTYFQTADDVKGTPGSDVRDVCTEDMQVARGLMTAFGNDDPRTEPGTTTVNVSQAVFNDLKLTGKTEFRYVEWIKADLPDADGYLHWEGGELSRVESGDVSLPVIVNGTPTTLPAIHASGTLVVEDKKARETSKAPTDRPTPTELFILDDPRNPLLLIYKMDVNNFRVQVTEIKFPVDKPVTKIEDDLLKNKKAVVYGIYFDFNKDTIRPESESVLKQIVQAMTDNPSWKLTVSGYTDNIGGDAYNLDLSKRRAAAVKQALVARYSIAPDRLSTNGFGSSSPVDTNDTFEGRARNRRVELTRE